MPRVSSRPPYTVLAHFYDQMIGEAVAMNRHARGKVLGAILSRARTVCDLGCGTGSTAIELARSGKKVYAVDLAPAMCRMARRKIRHTRLPVKVICADMRRLRLPEPVDLVLCEFNPLNHLPRKSDLGRVARAVFRALRPGGWFCFDLNTRRSLREQYPSTQWIQTRDYCVVIHGGFDSRRDKAWLEFEWFIPSDSEGFTPSSGSSRRRSRRPPTSWRRYRERLIDTCWSDAEIRRALRRAGFTRIRHWDGAAVRPPSPHQRRGFDAYYLAYKPTDS
jgi:SAM-dependent methyltransferase